MHCIRTIIFTIILIVSILHVNRSAISKDETFSVKHGNWQVSCSVDPITDDYMCFVFGSVRLKIPEFIFDDTLMVSVRYGTNARCASIIFALRRGKIVRHEKFAVRVDKNQVFTVATTKYPPSALREFAKPKFDYEVIVDTMCSQGGLYNDGHVTFFGQDAKAMINQFQLGKTAFVRVNDKYMLDTTQATVELPLIGFTAAHKDLLSAMKNGPPGAVNPY